MCLMVTGEAGYSEEFRQAFAVRYAEVQALHSVLHAHLDEKSRNAIVMSQAMDMAARDVADARNARLHQQEDDAVIGAMIGA